jgi:hypothetical protein
VLGLNLGICREVDDLVDVRPPLVSEVLPGEGVEEGLRRNFGYRKSEFPLMYGYVYKRFNIEGVRCLVVHFILDHIENLISKGFDNQMIRSEVETLVNSYVNECVYEKDLLGEAFSKVGDTLNQTLQLVLEKFDTIVNIIREDVELRLLPVDVVVNASSQIVSLVLKLTLAFRGFRGKRSYTISKEIRDKYYHQLYKKALFLVRQKLYEATVNHIIKNPQKLLESINNVRREVAEKAHTLSDVFQIIGEEEKRNEEFSRLIKIIQQSVKEIVDSFQPHQP